MRAAQTPVVVLDLKVLALVVCAGLRQSESTCRAVVQLLLELHRRGTGGGGGGGGRASELHKVHAFADDVQAWAVSQLPRLGFASVLTAKSGTKTRKFPPPPRAAAFTKGSSAPSAAQVKIVLGMIQTCDELPEEDELEFADARPAQTPS